MKNKIIIYSLLFSCTFLFTGCNDWLNLEPENSLTASDFWQDENDIQSVITSCYGALAQSTLTSNIYWTALRGGMVSPGSNSRSNEMEFFDFNITPNNYYVRWNEYYKVINYCNSVLLYAGDVSKVDPDLSEEQTNFYKSEALAIRSMCYLQLVKAFKSVPLILKPFDTDANELQVSKDDESVIMDQIIKDLNQALAWSKEEYDTPEENLGRIRTYSIHALLADAYLWDNKYEQCIASCDALINSFQFGLVNGAKYLDIFSDGNTSEGIFELQFDRTINEKNVLYALTANLPNGLMVASEYAKELFSDPREYRGNVVSIDFTTGSIWKYIGLSSSDRDIRRGSGNSDANWMYYRLSDIYLMKAEARAETENLDLAKAPLNLIRTRAGLNPINEFENKEAFLQILLQERAKEFIGEGKRWFDLVRVARRSPETRSYLILDNVLRNVSPQYVSSTEDKVKDTNSWYLPIYFSELEANKQLEQNDFYKTSK